jgi:hypothetical protein
MAASFTESNELLSVVFFSFSAAFLAAFFAEPVAAIQDSCGSNNEKQDQDLDFEITHIATSF